MAFSRNKGNILKVLSDSIIDTSTAEKQELATVGLGVITDNYEHTFHNNLANTLFPKEIPSQVLKGGTIQSEVVPVSGVSSPDSAADEVVAGTITGRTLKMEIDGIIDTPRQILHPNDAGSLVVEGFMNALNVSHITAQAEQHDKHFFANVVQAAEDSTNIEYGYDVAGKEGEEIYDDIFDKVAEFNDGTFAGSSAEKRSLRKNEMVIVIPNVVQNKLTKAALGFNIFSEKGEAWESGLKADGMINGVRVVVAPAHVLAGATAAGVPLTNKPAFIIMSTGQWGVVSYATRLEFHLERTLSTRGQVQLYTSADFGSDIHFGNLVHIASQRPVPVPPVGE